jgi:DNA mismatch repair protein MutL
LPEGTYLLLKLIFSTYQHAVIFLKSDTVEYRHVIDEFLKSGTGTSQHLFLLLHNGSGMFNLPPTSLRQRIVAVFAGKQMKN